jgi:ribosomal protein L37AE/L43A
MNARELNRESTASPQSWDCVSCNRTFEYLGKHGECPSCGSMAVTPHSKALSICPKCNEPVLIGELTTSAFGVGEQHVNCSNRRGLAMEATA